MGRSSVASPYSDDFQGDRLREADGDPREAGALFELCELFERFELFKRFKRTSDFARARRFTPTRGRSVTRGDTPRHSPTLSEA